MFTLFFLLALSKTGVSIVVPPGSIPESQTQEVYFKVCSRGLSSFAQSSSSPSSSSPSSSCLSKRVGEQLLSPLVMCGPQGLRFNKVRYYDFVLVIDIVAVEDHLT